MASALDPACQTWRALLFASAVLLVPGCDDGDNPIAPVPTVPTVSGTVLATATGEPVVGAEVSIGTATATTGLDGRFELTGLSAGPATLRCIATGFEDFEVDIIVASGGMTRDIMLTPVELFEFGAVAVVSGDGQIGKAGLFLEKELVVRVTDAQGNGVEGVEVTWRVASGAGDMRSVGPTGDITFADRLSKRTADGGIASVQFRPHVLGTSTVVAEVPGLQGSPLVFTTEANVMVILVGRAFGNEEVTYFASPGFDDEVHVPVGTTVEWWESPFAGLGGVLVHITSTSVPPNGEPFDSGPISLETPFRFVPNVAGTWEYVDQETGGTGRLTSH